MKIKLVPLGFAMLFTFASMTTSGLANPPAIHGEEEADHHQQGEGSEAGGHMGHMDDVLQGLKRELGAAYNRPVAAATNEQLALGKKIYTETCAACHGEEGQGDGPAAVAFKEKPSDFTDPEHSRYYSDQGRIHIIKNGISDTFMPGWKDTLNEQEILSVHAYIRSLRRPAKKEKQGHGTHSH